MEHRDRIPPPPARACACPLSQLRPDGGGFAPHAAFAYPGHCDARGRARGRLFDRDKKGIEPTTFGQVLPEPGAALLANEGDLRREIELLAGLETGVLAVGAGPYPAEISVGKAVTRLLRAPGSTRRSSRRSRGRWRCCRGLRSCARPPRDDSTDYSNASRSSPAAARRERSRSSASIWIWRTRSRVTASSRESSSSVATSAPFSP